MLSLISLAEISGDEAETVSYPIMKLSRLHAN
jgi:hypothetical protein